MTAAAGQFKWVLVLVLAFQQQPDAVSSANKRAGATRAGWRRAFAFERWLRMRGRLKGKPPPAKRLVLTQNTHTHITNGERSGVQLRQQHVVPAVEAAGRRPEGAGEGVMMMYDV
jgi:hypothetical protein